jgi:hypothetical protein
MFFIEKIKFELIGYERSPRRLAPREDMNAIPEIGV